MSESDDSENQEEETKKKLVGVRITDSRRQKWKDFVAESDEYGSMAEMMRTGVKQIISEAEDESDSKSIQKQLDTIADRQVRLIKGMENFREENKELFEQLDGAREIADEIVYIQEEISSDEQEE